MNFITKYLIFPLSFLCFSIHLQSQNKKIDSLKIVLQNHKEKDTIKVDLLNTLAFSYFTKDLDKALEYLDAAAALAEAIHFKKGKARSIYIRGITEAIQSNYDQALDYYNEALRLNENINFKKGIANCYNAMGITYRNKGELRKSIAFCEKAIEIEEEIGSENLSASLLNLGSSYDDLGEFDNAILYLKKALSIAKADKNEQRVAYSLNNLGIIYEKLGNYPLALENYKESLYMNEKLSDSISIAHNISNMGSVYKAQKYYDKGLNYYKKALGIYKRINNKHRVSSTLNGIGTIYEENKDYKNALIYYVDALRINKQIGTNSETPYILNNIGEVYWALKDYDTAKQYFVEAENIYIEIEDKQALCVSHLGLAKIYISQKDYKSALTDVLKAKEISKKAGLLRYQKEAEELLSKIYTSINDYKKALESYQQFKMLNDSLFNKKNIEEITALEYEYKYKQERDLAKIKELQLKKTVESTSQNLEKSQQNLLYGVIIFLIIMLLMTALLFYLKIRNEKSKTQNAVIEQKLLRSQMTPHFIFNSLSVLQGMILNKEEKNSISYLSMFSKLLRTILENSRHKMVSLSEELSAIDDYVTLQNLDENSPYMYALTVAPEIDTMMLKIPPMLIQPFIENVIEHAFPYQKEDKEIKVDISLKNEQLICTINDNGIGIELEKQQKNKYKNSLARTITLERLKILSKDLKKKGSIILKNKKSFGGQGTLVTLVIPYKIDLLV